MANDWHNYQEKVAEFFRALGCDAQIESVVQGARGKHEIDVLVTFVQYSFKNTWVVECKHWKSSVPKEKVLSLQAIVQDIGADKGFLLSESNFQSGAIACARNTNITLSSLADLNTQAKADINAAIVLRKLKEIATVSELVFGLSKHKTVRTRNASGKVFISSHGKGPPDSAKVWGRLGIAESALKKALAERYPAVCDFTADDEPVLAHDREAVLRSVDDHIRFAREYYAKYKDFEVHLE